MKVNNESFEKMLAKGFLKKAKQRNIFALISIIMTNILFTTIFTIIFSLNSSYQTYNFKQIGGYMHGSFKNVSEEQVKKIGNNKDVDSYGVRKYVGFSSEGVFLNKPAEISYMDSNSAKWSYINLIEGREPIGQDEIALDTSVLKMLNISPKIGNKVSIDFEVNDRQQNGEKISKTFTLVGYWKENKLLPIHYINVSKKYADMIESSRVKMNQKKLRLEMNIMLSSSINIEEQMKNILQEEKLEGISFGSNWGYSSSKLSEGFGIGTILSIVAFIIIIILTGYLIISNIFYISIGLDIRHYGLLRVVGATKRQIMKLVYRQAFLLSLIGIPIGTIVGYVTGSMLTPYIIEKMNMDLEYTISKEYLIIFAVSSIFTLATVMISCIKPARFVGKIAPVKAVDFSEDNSYRRRKKEARNYGSLVLNMAIYNLGRNRKRTLLVVSSIALSIVLFNFFSMFISGFSVDKYLEKKISADYIVSSHEYFNFEGGRKMELEDSVIDKIRQNLPIKLSGSGYSLANCRSSTWITEDRFRSINYRLSDVELEEAAKETDRKGNLLSSEVQIEGLDRDILDKKIKVIKGDKNQLLNNENGIAIVIDTDTYGNYISGKGYPEIGEKIEIDYIKDSSNHDETQKGNDEASKRYNVVAYVVVPYSIGFRFSSSELKAVLPVERLSKDSGADVNRLYYLFDLNNKSDRIDSEEFIKNLSRTKNNLFYESKNQIEDQFISFRDMFIVIGGLLCFIVGFIGILNYSNTLITSFITREREFAIMQAVGMSEKQMKKLMILEGCVYLFLSTILSMLLYSIIAIPLNSVLEKVFWFYEGRFILRSWIFTMITMFVVGYSIPYILYYKVCRTSLVERIGK